MKGPVLQFPVAAGAITVSYNLPGVKSGLKLDGPTIAEIFSGKITKWDDPAIKSLNPGVSLPSTSITVVHRSDSSGTTEGFTTYLSDVSSTWKSSIGEGKDVSGRSAPARPRTRRRRRGQADPGRRRVRRAGLRARERVHLRVGQELGRHLHRADDHQHLGRVQGVKVPADLGVSTINSPNATAYPIVSQTFLIAYQDPCKDGGLTSTTAKGLFQWLTYAFGPGQGTLGSGGNQLPYAGVPSSLLAKDQAQLKTMTCNGAPLSDGPRVDKRHTGFRRPLGSRAVVGQPAPDRSSRGGSVPRGADPGPDRLLLHPADR